MFYQVFQLEAPEDQPERTLPPGYSIKVWFPGLRSVVPPTLGPKFLLWWALHQLKLFRNRDYAALIVCYGGRPVHRTCLIPKYFRWPFMSDDDLQVSSIWTDPEHRGHGIAGHALRRAVSLFAKRGRSFWYVTHEYNRPSVSLCRSAGFRLKATGRRTKRLGLRMLGKLLLISGGSPMPPGALSGARGLQPGRAMFSPCSYKDSAVSADSRIK